MSLSSKLVILGIGGGIVAALVLQQKKQRTRRFSEALPADPEIEAALDLASLEIEESPLPVLDSSVDVSEVTRDTGDLYGAHTPRAVDRTHPDDDLAMAEGQNWIEALETDAIEYGAEPERPLDMSDDRDLSSRHSTDTRDTPVADRGAGGPGGL
jgi:hypothetical protein